MDLNHIILVNRHFIESSLENQVSLQWKRQQKCWLVSISDWYQTSYVKKFIKYTSLWLVKQVFRVYFFCQSSFLVSKNIFNNAHDLGLWCGKWRMVRLWFAISLTLLCGPLYLTLVRKCRRLVWFGLWLQHSSLPWPLASVTRLLLFLKTVCVPHCWCWQFLQWLLTGMLVNKGRIG